MGTEEFWIPAAVAALGSGVQAVNQHNANSRQQASEVQAIQDQQQLESTGAAEANALTKQVAQNDPSKIQGQATGDYIAQLRRNAAGAATGGSTTDGTQTFGSSTSSLAPNVNGNARYNTDKSTAQSQVQDYGDTYATEMGGLDSAIRQRQNEGLAMSTLGTNLNTLGAQSQTTNFVDQLRAQASGQPNPWVNMLGGMLTGGANAYSKNPG